jgi:hypothetical protein
MLEMRPFGRTGMHLSILSFGSAYGTKRTSKTCPLMSTYRGSAKLDCFAPLAMTTGFAGP